MPLIIGTDEAGYGPNLGPLVVTATAWRCPGEPTAVDLLNALSPLAKPPPAGLQLAVGDSKKLFQPRGSFELVESTLFTFLESLGIQPGGWRDFLGQLDPAYLSNIADLPWYRDFELQVPVDLRMERLDRITSVSRPALDQLPVEFIDVQSAVIEPDQFNRLCVERGNKATVLSETTLGLVSSLLEKHIDAKQTDDSALVVCDKHGGRNKYAAVIQSVLPDRMIRVVGEGRACSTYQLTQNQSCFEFRFQTKGERFFPVALASMFSKYARELTMKAVNSYWSAQVPGIRPTAGYPVDAERFGREIESRAAELNIDRETYWRQR